MTHASASPPAGAAAGRRRPTIIVGPQPPPVHGASLVTSVVTSLLREHGGSVVVENTAVDGTGLGYHVRRAARHLAAARTIWRLRVGASAYLTGVGGHALVYQVVIVALCRIGRVPVIYHHHSYAYLEGRSSAMAALVAVGGSTIHHVTLSSRMAELLKTRYRRAVSGSVCSNVHFLPAPARRTRQGSAAPLRIGHLSNLCVDKGIARVLAAYLSVLDGGVDAELHLAGPTADAEAVAVLARARREVPGVSYWGRLSRDQVSEFMGSIDLFLFPSTCTEAQPLVVLEALLAGVPVIALPVGCLGDLNDIDDHAVPDEAAFTAAVVEVATRRAAGDPSTTDSALAIWAGQQLAGLDDSGPTFLQLFRA